MSAKSAAWIRKQGATGRARRLRHDETDAEARLSSDLRGRRLNGHKFARQIPLGAYIVDFICREKLLVIELDGSQHADSQYDIVRTRWLNENGYSVLRFWNYDAFQERPAVLDTIVAALEGRMREGDNSQFYSATAALKTPSRRDN